MDLLFHMGVTPGRGVPRHVLLSSLGDLAFLLIVFGDLTFLLFCFGDLPCLLSTLGDFTFQLFNFRDLTFLLFLCGGPHLAGTQQTQQIHSINNFLLEGTWVTPPSSKVLNEKEQSTFSCGVPPRKK